jgi:hypothetical protein
MKINMISAVICSGAFAALVLNALIFIRTGEAYALVICFVMSFVFMVQFFAAIKQKN